MSLGPDDAHLTGVSYGSLGSGGAWGSLGAFLSSWSCHSGGSLGSRLARGGGLPGEAWLAALSCGALQALGARGAARALGTLGERAGGVLISLQDTRQNVRRCAKRTKHFASKQNIE